MAPQVSLVIYLNDYMIFWQVMLTFINLNFIGETTSSLGNDLKGLSVTCVSWITYVVYIH